MDVVRTELIAQVTADPTCLSKKEGDDVAKENKNRGNHAMNIINLSIQIALYKHFFAEDLELCFKRNWALPGGTKFRTTWSAGWYIRFRLCPASIARGHSMALKYTLLIASCLPDAAAPSVSWAFDGHPRTSCSMP